MMNVSEYKAFRINGFVAILTILIIGVCGIYQLISSAKVENVVGILTGIGIVLLGIALLPGLVPVQPNESRVLLFLGKYTGVIRDSGFWWTNPLAMKKKVSLRVRNFNSETTKVNEATGNPIEIAAVVVWRVVDSAKALFDVESFVQFVDIQSETAIRALAASHPYDPIESNEISLRTDPETVAEELKKKVQERLNVAGVEIIEARLTHLAYAPEIAQAMLRRQQAQAVIAARRLIVEAAVGMVKQALTDLSEQNIVELDEERKAAMVNNMMVVLTGEQGATPVINTGTLYT